jgi:hypothetical protein
MKLSTLKKHAQHAARHYGHRMTWGRVYGTASGPKGQNGQCRDCQAYAFVSESSERSVLTGSVSGLAVAIHCKDGR